MFCKHCGNKIREGARFCPICGQRIEDEAESGKASETTAKKAAEPDEQNDPAAEGNTTTNMSAGTDRQGEEVPVSPSPGKQTTSDGASADSQNGGERPLGPTVSEYASAKDTEQSSLDNLVRSTRGRARRKVPLILIVILVTLGLAGAAFAATYIYRHYFSPETKAEQVAVEEEKSAEEAQREEESRLEASRALYNDVLSDYQDAQSDGWAYTTGNEDQPWYEDVAVLSQCEQSGMIPFYTNDLSGWEVKYAYTDLGEDGVQDLVVAIVRPDASPDDYTVVGIFTSDGKTVYSAINGRITMRDWWHILAGGLVSEGGSAGAEMGAYSTYTVAKGQLELVDEASVDRTRTPKYLHNGEEISEDEYNSLVSSNSTQAALEWNNLADFLPIQADTTNLMDSETAALFESYASKCKEYIAAYGEPKEATSDNQRYNYYSGLALADLIDFNGDGTDELLLAYYDGSDFSTEVWSYSNDSLVEVYSYRGIPGSIEDDFYEWLVISSYDNTLTLYEYAYSDDVTTLTTTGYQLKNGSFKAVVTATGPGGNGYSSDSAFTVNGANVSYDDYSAALGTSESAYRLKWAASSEIYNDGSGTQCDAKTETEKTLRQLGIKN